MQQGLPSRPQSDGLAMHVSSGPPQKAPRAQMGGTLSGLSTSSWEKAAFAKGCQGWGSEAWGARRTAQLATVATRRPSHSPARPPVCAGAAHRGSRACPRLHTLRQWAAGCTQTR